MTQRTKAPPPQAPPPQAPPPQAQGPAVLAPESQVSAESPPETPELDDVAALSFEAALAELEGIVKRLEEGQGQLDDAIAAYDRGVRLKQHCEGKLKDARMRIERIVGEGARLRAEPFDPAAG